MGQTAIRPAEILTSATMPAAELVLLGAVVLLVIVLLMVRLRRSHDRKLRKAAGSGYHDFDVARYGHRAVGTSLIEASISRKARPLAPSFVSPKRATDPRAGSAPPVAIPSLPGPVDRSLRTGGPTADRGSAQAGRSSPTPSTGDLPPLVQPPPPSGLEPGELPPWWPRPTDPSPPE